MTPKTKHEQILYSRLELKLIEGIDYKRERLSLGNKLPMPMLIILFIGGLMILFIVCIAYSTENNFYFTLVNIAIAILVGFYFALAIDLDTPYSDSIGHLHLNSSPYIEEIIKQLA